MLIRFKTVNISSLASCKNAPPRSYLLYARRVLTSRQAEEPRPQHQCLQLEGRIQELYVHIVSCPMGGLKLARLKVRAEGAIGVTALRL